MKRILAFALLGLSAVACNPVQGQLTILKPFSYVNSLSDQMINYCRNHPQDHYCRGADLANTSVDFQPGNYSAKLEFPNKTQMRLVFKGASAQNENTFTFAIPKEQQLPGYSGRFALSAKQTGQQFDIAGTVDTEVSDSSPVRARESCSETEYVRSCRWENLDGDAREVCETDTITVYGNEDVEYYYRTTDKNVVMSLLEPGRNVELARFSGTASDSDKIYTYRSGCIIHSRPHYPGRGIGPGPHPGARPLPRGPRR